ncbi:MAG: hypothetical protein KBF73_07020 [Flavobacteriales bacterium]|nr:hypothetical protein [Flavobacteriales bacterium]
MDPTNGPLDPPTGPLDPTIGPLDPPTGPLDPTIRPLDPPTGPLDPTIGPLDPPTGSLDPTIGPLDPTIGSVALRYVPACSKEVSLASSYLYEESLQQINFRKKPLPNQLTLTAITC